MDNEFRGTPPGTYSHGFVVGHYTHDLLVRGNRLSSPPPSGKTWRFLVITGYGLLDRIERNIVEGVGARDDDTIPWSNEPEIILTEGYSLKYEGKVIRPSPPTARSCASAGPRGTDPDRRCRRDPERAGRRPVAAGRAGPRPDDRAARQAIPHGTDTVSISQGFVAEVFEGNRIDIRGGRRSDCFVLPGNHFGTRVADNHLLGGGWRWG